MNLEKVRKIESQSTRKRIEKLRQDPVAWAAYRKRRNEQERQRKVAKKRAASAPPLTATHARTKTSQDASSDSSDTPPTKVATQKKFLKQ
jgi:hypothetical protein